MSTAESIGAYSPTTVYGQLTSPFSLKIVSINSHTPFDKVNQDESKVFSRDYFEGKPIAKMKYSLPETPTKEINTYQQEKNINTDSSNKEQKKDTENTPIEVAGFSMSLASSSSDIVQSSLKQGYSTEQAVVISKAQSSYERSAILTKDPTGVLSTCNYVVS